MKETSTVNAPTLLLSLTITFTFTYSSLKASASYSRAARRRLFGRSARTRDKDEPAGDRTQDLRIKSPLLYQLSYRLPRNLPPNVALTKELLSGMGRLATAGGWVHPPPRPRPLRSGTIGAWGYDFRDGSLLSPGTPDLMSACSPKWVSDYHFTNALRFRLLDETRTAARIVLAPTPVLLLWGGADANGDPFLEPAFVANAPPSLPARSGAYRIRGVSTEGRVLFSLDFDMHETADGDGGSSFAFALPARPEWASDLASITLVGPGGSATLDGNSDRTAALVRNTVTGRVRGIFRDWSTTAAQAGSGLAAMLREPNLEIQVSRGIPAAASWRR